MISLRCGNYFSTNIIMFLDYQTPLSNLSKVEYWMCRV